MDRSATPSRSRFSHFYDGSLQTLNNHNGINISHDRDEMVVTAGIGFRSPSNGHSVSEMTGSFATTVINGCHGSGDVKVETIPEASSARNGIIGQVSFREVENAIPNGHQSMLQQQVFSNSWKSEQTVSLPNPLQEFQIFVKYINGNGKRYAFMVKATDTVEHLKQLIYQRLEIETDKQKLFYGCKTLDQSMTLGHYGIQKGSEISLERETLRLRGG